MSRKKKISPLVSMFFRDIGRKGGHRTSPAKTEANRLNARKRWAKVRKAAKRKKK